MKMNHKRFLATITCGALIGFMAAGVTTIPVYAATEKQEEVSAADWSVRKEFKSIPTMKANQTAVVLGEGKADIWTCGIEDTSVVKLSADVLVQEDVNPDATNSQEGFGDRYLVFEGLKANSATVVTLKNDDAEGNANSIISLRMRTDANKKVRWSIQTVQDLTDDATTGTSDTAPASATTVTSNTAPASATTVTSNTAPALATTVTSNTAPVAAMEEKETESVVKTFTSFEDLKKAAGFMPMSLPAVYQAKEESYSLSAGVATIEETLHNDDKASVALSTAKGNTNITIGNPEKTKSRTINDIKVTVGTGAEGTAYFNAFWTKDGMSYAVDAKNVDKTAFDEMLAYLVQ